MNARMKKLTYRLEAKLAQRLVEAGLDTPRKLKAAKDKDIKKVPGVGQAGVDKVRQAFPET